jgi:hypothetical protein
MMRLTRDIAETFESTAIVQMEDLLASRNNS